MLKKEIPLFVLSTSLRSCICYWNVFCYPQKQTSRSLIWALSYAYGFCFSFGRFEGRVILLDNTLREYIQLNLNSVTLFMIPKWTKKKYSPFSLVASYLSPLPQQIHYLATSQDITLQKRISVFYVPIVRLHQEI